VSRARPLESTSQEARSNGLNVNGDFGAAGGVGVPGGVEGVDAGAAARCEPGVMLPSHWVSPVSSPGRVKSVDDTAVEVNEFRSLGFPVVGAKSVDNAEP
jgi:hypothetical protein